MAAIVDFARRYTHNCITFVTWCCLEHQVSKNELYKVMKSEGLLLRQILVRKARMQQCAQAVRATTNQARPMTVEGDLDICSRLQLAVSDENNRLLLPQSASLPYNFVAVNERYDRDVGEGLVGGGVLRLVFWTRTDAGYLQQ